MEGRLTIKSNKNWYLWKNVNVLVQLYITDRKFYLIVNKEISEWMTSKVGIPQGAVLSPLVMLVWIMSSPKHTQNTTVVTHGHRMGK